MKKDTAILFASSETFAYALFVSIKSLFKNSPILANNSDIFIYTYHWSDKTKHIFSDNFPVTIHNYELPDYIPQTKYILRFTPALFARFEAFSLLEKYKRVICMDSDILVQKELYKDINGIVEQIALTKDSISSVGKNFTNNIPGYDLTVPCYNAGFIVLNNIDNPQKIHKWLYDMLAKYANYCVLGDQGLINLMLQEFNLKLLTLPQYFNQPASSSNKVLRKSYIIHSTGHRKFWCYYYFKDWYNLYTDWIEAGGKHDTFRKNTNTWNKLVKTILSYKKEPSPKFISFFQLAPDLFKYPGKFILFSIKHFLNIQY